jgi:hypothetical protein
MKKLYEYTIEELRDMPVKELHKLQAETDLEKFEWYEKRPFMDRKTRLLDFYEQSVKQNLKIQSEVKDEKES